MFIKPEPFVSPFGDEALTAKEAAKLIGVDARTLRRWHANGTFMADLVRKRRRLYGKQRVLEFAKYFARHKGDILVIAPRDIDNNDVRPVVRPLKK